MKKTVKIMALIMSILCICGVLAACNFDDVGGTEQIDKSKIQLYISCWNGGYGVDWIYALKERFEAEHANDVFEGGKKGVQIMISPETNHNYANTAQTILSGTQEGSPEIYFTENDDIRALIRGGAVLEINDVVTGTNKYETSKTIESKLTDNQKDFLKVDGKYYAIPSYQGEYGIAYDIGLFDEYGFYIAENSPVDATAANQVRLIRAGVGKSVGPDGVAGTSDDGLPRTFTEFFALCKFMVDSGVIPMSWSGTYYGPYISGFMNTLTNYIEGREQANITYTLDGTATSLGTVSNANTWIPDASATTFVPNGGNGANIRRQKGVYDSVYFVNELINGYDGSYHEDDLKAFGQYSHKENQKDFLMSSKIGGNEKPIAMIIDGVWWEHEALETFNYMEEKYGSEYSMKNRKMGWLPLPMPDSSKLTQNPTWSDGMNAFLFVKSNIANSKKEIAKEFLQFANTDVSLVEFSKITNTLKALQYDIEGEDYEALSPFGKSLYDNSKSSPTFYCYSNSKLYLANINSYNPIYFFNINDTQSAPQYLHANPGNLKGCFEGINAAYAAMFNKTY